jgi:hypothetical protein
MDCCSLEVTTLILGCVCAAATARVGFSQGLQELLRLVSQRNTPLVKLLRSRFARSCAAALVIAFCQFWAKDCEGVPALPGYLPSVAFRHFQSFRLLQGLLIFQSWSCFQRSKAATACSGV